MVYFHYKDGFYATDFDVSMVLPALEQAEKQKLSQDIEALASDIFTIAKSLNIKVDLSQAQGYQATNLPPLFYQGRYLSWYAQAQSRSKQFRTQIKQLTVDNEEDNYNGEDAALYRQLLQEYRHYKMATDMQTGNCDNLARAAIYYILAHTDYQGSIHRIQGVNVDHAFILINCKNIPEGDFKLEDLPPNAMIIDPWMRCKFTVEHAPEYYNDNFSALRKGDEQKGALIFEVGESIPQDKIHKAREFLKGADEQKKAVIDKSMTLK